MRDGLPDERLGLQGKRFVSDELRVCPVAKCKFLVISIDTILNRVLPKTASPPVMTR